jgi:hypothetical protein
MIPPEFERLVPDAVAWVKEMEKEILENGQVLSPARKKDAKEIGIDGVEDVRVVVRPNIPKPHHPELAALAHKTNLITERTGGMTFGHGIVLMTAYENDRSIIAHELVHVKQYEQFGGIEPFLRAYLPEVLLPPGYPHGPMEQQAAREALRVCSLPN